MAKLLAVLCLLLVVGVAHLQTADQISRYRGNVLQNITRTQSYLKNIVTSPLDASDGIRQLYRSLRNMYSNILGGTGQRDQGSFLQQRVPDRLPFPCDTKYQRSRSIPKSVHQLRPGDIDVVAAVGDSLTSATAANSAALWEVMIENRGVSWCIGGQGNWRTHMTLPNILKEFNPRLFGYSLEDSYNVHRAAQFNVAENIATTSDMPYNAEKLVKRMRLDKRVNIQTQWKLITFMIGGNDFCSDICFQTNATSWLNDNQEAHLIKTLRFMKDNLPRTFVNLVPSPLINLAISMDRVQVPWTCNLARPIECSCFFGPSYSSNRALFRSMERKFVKIMERVSHMPEFHSNDFTVVYQPFFKEASVFLGNENGVADMQIVSVDCIHLSQKGHAIAANALWNNMLQTTQNKSLGLKKLFGEFECPTAARPYLATYFNE